MSAHQLAAALLASAVLVAPAPAVRRIPMTRRPDHLPAVALTATAAAAVAAVLAVLAPLPLLVLCLFSGLFIGARVRRRRRQHRCRREGQVMAAALEVLVGELRVGAHPLAAFTAAAAESVDDTARALRAVAGRAQLGADVAEGMRTVALTSPVPHHWTRLAVFWDLATQHGLALATLMWAAHRDIVERQRFADRMQAALAGARATTAILAALPALGVLLGQLIGADPVRFLLGGGLGGALLAIGVGLICVGVAWADRIVDRLAT